MLRRSAVVLVLLSAAIFAAAPHADAGPWVRVQSAHFTVSGNVGEKQAREVATRLEQFREILVRIFPGARLAVRPLFVVAFDSEKSFTPYKPLYDGKPAPVAGYFTWNSDGSCVTLQLDRGEESYPIIFHEYAHLFLTQTSRQLPSWMSEGVAEYYSTVELVDRGQRANIGKPVLNHRRRLEQRFMGLRELLSVTQASKMWSNRDDAALFYAESWALVHYLSSQKGGAGQIAAFAQRVRSGRPDIEAFEEVFGPISTIEPALRHYLQSGAIFEYTQFHFNERVDAERVPARPMSAGEVEATLATILIHLGRSDDAARHVDAALKAAPDLAEASAVQGLYERRAGSRVKSERALRTAVEKDPANLDAAYYWGLSLVETPDGDQAGMERALAALSAVVPKDNPPADVLMVMGVLQGQTGHLDEAEASLRRSMALAPGQTRTTVALADVFIRRGKFNEARGLLGPMIARPSYPGEADVARSQLEWLSRAEAQAKQREEIARIASQPASEASAPTPTPSTTSSARSNASASGFSPIYRTMGTDERRQLGVLETIDCGPHGLVLEIKTSNGSMRFHAARFEDVEFLTYRDDLRGAVMCGPRANAEPVYLTWKPISEILPAPLGKINGRGVAVEFLPK